MGLSIVKNYGLLWSREFLNKDLKGYLRKDPSFEINFQKQIGIYILYNQNHEVVYVGQAGSQGGLFRRINAHCRDSKWLRWEFFSWFGFFDVDKTTKQLIQSKNYINKYEFSSALSDLEGILINVMEPSLNKKGYRFDGAEEYRQCIDPSLSFEQKLLEIDKKVDQLSQKINKLLAG